MFLGYQKDKIKFYTNEELDREIYCLDKIEETNEEYILYKDEYLLKSAIIKDLLDKAKINKQKEASDKAKKAIEEGYVEYKNAKIETNTQTVSDLNTIRQMCVVLNETSYNWLSKDDILLQLNIDKENPVENDDFVKIGILIADYKNMIWTEKYTQYLNLINNAETLEEVENININYEIGE